jgi:hypothetical protein
MSDALEQLLHPFDTQHIVRGPFTGQPTGLYKQTVKGTITVPATGWCGVIATPYFQNAALTWAPASIAGAIAEADFTAVPYGAAASVAATYWGLRPLAGGVKLTATGTPNTVTGTMYCGLATPGMTILAVNYSAFAQTPFFRSQQAFTPGEAIFEVDCGVANMGLEYRNLSSTSRATVLNDSFYAFPMIFVTGATAAQTFAYEATFIMEGMPNGSSTGFATFDTSRLTYDDFQRVLMAVPRVVGGRFVRSGMSAIADGGHGSSSRLLGIGRALAPGLVGKAVYAAAQELGPTPSSMLGNMAQYGLGYL